MVNATDRFHPELLYRDRTTETSLIAQISSVARSLTLLRKFGFKVALDDFGSGYSSLRYFTSLPADIIKFDITLIQGMMDERLGKLVQRWPVS